MPFGRIATDEVRIGVVGRDRSLPPRELYDRIDDALTRFDRRWRGADRADLARRGLHPTRGELTVAQMPDPFIVGHLEPTTSVQLEPILAGPTPPADAATGRERVHPLRDPGRDSSSGCSPAGDSRASAPSGSAGCR